LGEILEKVGLHGLDEKIIAARTKEGEMEEAAMEGEGNESKQDGDDKELIGELEKTHISKDTQA
jgi:hypothetical protein